MIDLLIMSSKYTKNNETVLVNLLISSADKTEEIRLRHQIMIEEDLKFNENQLEGQTYPKMDGTDHNLQISLIPLKKACLLLSQQLLMRRNLL